VGFFKKKVLYNRYYKDLSNFIKFTIKFFQSFDGYANEMESLLGGGFEGQNYT